MESIFSSFSITIVKLWWMRKRPKHTIIIFGKHTHIKFVHGLCAGCWCIFCAFNLNTTSAASTQRHSIEGKKNRLAHTERRELKRTHKNMCSTKKLHTTVAVRSRCTIYVRVIQKACEIHGLCFHILAIYWSLNFGEIGPRNMQSDWHSSVLLLFSADSIYFCGELINAKATKCSTFWEIYSSPKKKHIQIVWNHASLTGFTQLKGESIIHLIPWIWEEQ